MRRWLCLAAAAMVAAACGDGNTPQPGPLNVGLTGPQGARAVVFLLSGPGAGGATVSAPSGATGLLVLSGAVAADTLRVAVLAPQGQVLNGIMATVMVPDVSGASAWKATLQQVALPSYALASHAQFTATVTRP